MIHAEAAGMYRCISTQAIVIRRERYGEFHKSLSLLTSDLGLISATAYGAYKMQSRLRMGSEPFTWSRTLLYHNPVKHSYKVTDMEVRGSFSGLQADLSRMAAASLWAEVVQKSYGAGETSGMLFPLFLDSLALLVDADARVEPYVTLQFLWRFLCLAGYQPDLGSCDKCGLPIGDTQPVHYSAGANAILCGECGSHLGDPLPAGALRYLEATQALPLQRAVSVQMEPAGLRALRGALPRMVQSVLEGELVSLPWVGAGR
jgi:DNA repair protein RecO (recombination protein O)